MRERCARTSNVCRGTRKKKEGGRCFCSIRYKMLQYCTPRVLRSIGCAFKKVKYPSKHWLGTHDGKRCVWIPRECEQCHALRTSSTNRASTMASIGFAPARCVFADEFPLGPAVLGRDTSCRAWLSAWSKPPPSRTSFCSFRYALTWGTCLPLSRHRQWLSVSTTGFSCFTQTTQNGAEVCQVGRT